MTREERTSAMLHLMGGPLHLSDEALAAKALLVEHFRGKGGLPIPLKQYREQHPMLSLEQALLGLFGEICG